MTEFAPYPTTAPALRRLALIGNPNTGKTTLFNRLCGMRARTANYPGVTADARIGRLAVGSELLVEITDLPGLYGLDLSLPEADLCRRALAGELRGRAAPEALLVVLDASNLRRSLVLFDEARCSARPTLVALNMIDEAERRAIGVHVERLAEELGCPVVAVNARTGDGLAALIGAIRERFTGEPRGDAAWPKRTEAQRTAWAAELSASVTRRVATSRRSRGLTDAIDRFVVHPVSGTLLFAAVMAALFTVIFSLAAYPMDGIESIFGWLGERVADVVPAGAFRDFLVDGVIGGVAGTVVFLPQICLLFFLLTLLEDSGYLARAAFMIDGPLRRFGLPGTAFVPLLSSHACALPGIMAARLIADPRDRIATILVAPFMSCSARIPVYVLLITLLFPDGGWKAGLAFFGCYVLGAVTALLVAFVVRRTVLSGRSRPLLIELPSYQRPSLRNALSVTWDRGSIFLRKAGTVILSICVVLWVLSHFPGSEAPPEALDLRARAEASSDPAEAETLVDRAEQLESRSTLRHSVAGRLGVAVEPILAPLGYDWQLSIGVLSSFAAREVFVSTLLVMLGIDEKGEIEDPSLIDVVRHAKRDDGTALLDRATSWSLLVFYVLAMQCLPTLAVTRREAGGWRWAALQLAVMTGLAYGAAALTHALLRIG